MLKFCKLTIFPFVEPLPCFRLLVPCSVLRPSSTVRIYGSIGLIFTATRHFRTQKSFSNVKYLKLGLGILSFLVKIFIFKQGHIPCFQLSFYVQGAPLTLQFRDSAVPQFYKLLMIHYNNGLQHLCSSAILQFCNSTNEKYYNDIIGTPSFMKFRDSAIPQFCKCVIKICI